MSTEGSSGLPCQRDRFFLPRDLHYLNCAYISPLPRAVEEAVVLGLRRKRIPVEIGPEDFFRESDRARELFAGLVGAPDPGRVALLPAASYGVAVAARNLPVERGQNLVLTHEQFPGNVYSWRRVARERGAEIRTISPPDRAVRGREWSARILEAIDADTAVVTMAHVHWTDGTRFDLEAIGERAREMGAALVVDGTQSVGALSFDVGRIRPDALIVAAYKWLLAPYSTAVAYFGPRFDEGIPLEETWIAREGSEDFQGLVDYTDAYQPGAVRYDVGERSNFALLPGLVAALELVREWTPEGVQAYCRELTRELVSEAAELGFRVEEDAWRASHVFGLRMPGGVGLTAMKEALRERSVVASLRGSALRVSPHLYNDEEDVGALLEVLREAA